MQPAAPTPLETVCLSAGAALVWLAPERGGMATRWAVGDDDVLYLDEATLLDRGKNVRGGCPVLFPSPGRLVGDRFARDGATGTLGQHGFARTEPWDVVSASASEATLRLRSNDRTRAVFPWEFVATYRYVLGPTSLRIEQTFESAGPAPMPFGAGFHPYFRVRDADKRLARAPTAATRAYDNAARALVRLDGPIDLTRGEVDLHLIDHASSTARLERGDGHAVDLRGSAQFGRWVIWTLAGRDFVCLEPWTSPANALNTGEGLLRAAPGTPVTLSIELRFV